MKITNKQKRTKRNYKVLILVLVGLAILLLSYYFISLKLGTWPNETTKINTSPATQAEIDAGNKSKTDTIENDGKNVTGSDSPAAPIKDESNNTSSTQVDITSVNQSSSNLTVKVLIQTILSTGECTITMKNGALSYTSTVPVQALPSTSTCEGFSIPLNQLSKGAWQSTISVKSGSIVGSTSKEIQVK